MDESWRTWSVHLRRANCHYVKIKPHCEPPMEENETSKSSVSAYFLEWFADGSLILVSIGIFCIVICSIVINVLASLSHRDEDR
eukprot:scaffold719_cov117-Cylindrotheca_fusiformis.AAC.8